MKLFNQPQYALAMKNNLCSFTAYINDIPAFNNRQGTAYNLSVPINHLIKHGENSFKVQVTPLKPSTYLQELSECFAIILVKDLFDNADEFIEISITGFPTGTSNDTLKLPAFEIKGKFDATLPFVDYLWVNATKLDQNRSTLIDLARRYFHAFHEALIKKDTNHLFHEIALREKEFSMAFYDDYDEGFAKTQKDFMDTLNDENYRLQELDLVHFIPRFYADDRIITFENEKSEQPIFFINEVEHTRRQYPLFLCMNEKNKMLLIR